jgi:hypothetical protein
MMCFHAPQKGAAPKEETIMHKRNLTLALAGATLFGSVALSCYNRDVSGEPADYQSGWGDGFADGGC